MGLLRRCGDVVTANLNDLVDRCEQPEKMLKQAVREMEQAVGAALDGAAKVIASERLLARQAADNRQRAEQWRSRARDLLSRGDEAGARLAAARTIECERIALAIDAQRAAAEQTAARLRRRVDTMQIKVDEARHQLASLIARRRAAEAQRTVATHLHAATAATPFARYERLLRQVEGAEAEADALGELLGHAPNKDGLSDPVDPQFEDERELQIAEELARLRDKAAAETTAAETATAG
jgi:phage shock protein A